MTTHENDSILLCFDGSAGAKLAIAEAGALFPGRAAVVLHVWTPLAVSAFAYGAMMIPSVDESDIRAAAQAVAETGATLARAAGLHATAEIAEATYEGTWHAVVERASERDAAVIVIGARGLSTFRSFVLGSVSHGVAQHADRPVLVIPPSTRVAAGERLDEVAAPA